MRNGDEMDMWKMCENPLGGWYSYKFQICYFPRLHRIFLSADANSDHVDAQKVRRPTQTLIAVKRHKVCLKD